MTAVPLLESEIEADVLPILHPSKISPGVDFQITLSLLMGRSGECCLSIIKNGGERPNVIPSCAEMEFYLRTPLLKELPILTEKAENCFKAAALATGCKVELSSECPDYWNVLQNKSLEQAYMKNGEVLGMKFPDETDLSGACGSTDFGNVSYIVPGIHPYFYIGSDALNHTEEYTQSAGSEVAQKYALRTAKALAMTALDVAFRPGLLEQVREDFRQAKLSSSAEM